MHKTLLRPYKFIHNFHICHFTSEHSGTDLPVFTMLWQNLHNGARMVPGMIALKVQIPACLKVRHQIYTAKRGMFPAFGLISFRNMSAESTGPENGSDFEDDADFAGRKKEICGLNAEEQDKKYYPCIGDVRRALQEGEDDVRTIRVPEFRKRYAPFFKEHPDVRRIDDKTYIMGGKIKSIRKAGRGSYFLDIVQDYAKVQLMAHHKAMALDKEEFVRQHAQLRPGDQCVCIGNPAATRVGELSLRLTKPIRLVAPALHPLPPKLTDTALINRNRVVDYLVNARARRVILARAAIVSALRRFLDERSFIEVSTPVIGAGNSGANATPFVTSSVHLRQKNNESRLEKLSLRVAPELWLKRLVIGGFDKIYEIGAVYRNEGVDATHNPEFTTCEFYQTYTSLDELMTLTERLFRYICGALVGGGSEYADLCRPQCAALLAAMAQAGGRFRRLDFVRALEAQAGVALPHTLTQDNLIEYYGKLGLKVPEIASAPQLLDNLSAVYLEPLCKELPTFIYNMPEALSPLAKSAGAGAAAGAVSRRFELYIGGKEVVNAYEEENNPFKQRRKFAAELRNRDKFRDAESILPDYRYTQFMEWGMPPTAGWGIGVDRLAMLLTGSDRIESVLTFGRLPDVLKQ